MSNIQSVIKNIQDIMRKGRKGGAEEVKELMDETGFDEDDAVELKDVL